MAQKKASFDAKAWWDGLSPTNRRNYMWGFVGVGVLFLSYFFMTVGGTGGRTRDPLKEDARVENSLLPDENARDIGMSGIAQDVEGQREEQQSLAERLGRLEEVQQERDRAQSEGGGVRGREQQMREELDALRAQVEELQKSGGAVGQGGTSGDVVAPMPMPAQPGEASTVGYGGIRSIGDEQAQAGGDPTAVNTSFDGGDDASEGGGSDAAAPRMYLPSGSIITGVMMTGLDAPTGKGALRDPVPVLVRIQKEAILPNMFRADIRECFALVAGQGDLASERAYLRSESISCVRTDKTVIDLQIKAYVVDTDGKAGLRGRLVTKQGSALSKAILASFADGVAQAFSGSDNSVSNGQIDYGAAAESGAVNGVSSSLDRISKYYLDLADQMFPILEIDAGRRVTLVLVKGVEMSSVR